jgi:hypothetical protein
MTCTQLQALFSDHYDNALDAEAADAFAAHTHTCPACAQAYEAYKRLFDEVRALPAPPVPDGLHASLMTAVSAYRRQSAPPSRWGMFGRVGGSVAACFVLLSLFVSGLSSLLDSPAPLHERAAHENTAPAGFAAPAEVATPAGVAAPAPLAEAIMLDIAEEAEMYDYEITDEAGLFALGAETVFEAEQSAARTPTEEVAPSAPALSGIAPAPPMDTGGGVAVVGTADGIFIQTPGQGAPSVLAQGFYEQFFEIHIQVDDVAQAAQLISRMDGYSLQAQTYFVEHGEPFGVYNRRVPAYRFEHAQDTLRQLGEVTHENTRVVKRSDEASDLQARLNAKDEEANRLTALLAQSHTMDVLVAVERQLGGVNHSRDAMRGQLNRLNGVCSEPHITVYLTANPPEPVMIAAEPFGKRLQNRFVRSLNTFIRVMEGAAIVFSALLVPLAVMGMVAGPIVFIVRKTRRKKP